MTPRNMKLHLNSQTVGIMEDDPATRNHIKKKLSSLGFVVHIADGAHKVVELAEKKDVRQFILDINMGRGHNQEGLDALERLKNLDRTNYVAILSAHPEYYQRMATRLQANYFREKTAELEQDIYTIVNSMLDYHSNINRMNKESFQQLAPITVVDSDVNVISFEKLNLDATWRETHRGNYVAFVSGEFVDKEMDRSKLLKRVREKYPDSPIFFAQVEDEETILDIPTPLDISDE